DPPPGVFAVLGSARFRTPHASWYPCFTPGGSAVVSVGSGEVRVTDARTGRPRWRADLPGDELDGHQLPLPQVGPDGGVAVLVAGQQAGRVDRFDPAGRPLGRVDFPRLDAPHVWALSGDGRRAVAASALTPGKAVLRVFDARTGKPAATHHPADVRGPFGQAVLSADGRRVAIGDNDTARVFDTDTGAVVDAWEMPGQHPIELTFTPDGGRVIAVRHGSPPAAVVRDLVAKRGVALPPVYLWWRAVGPDGRTLAGPDGQGGIGVWDLGSGRLVRRFGGGWNTRVGALSPDGRTLVTAGDYGAFTLWDAAAGDRLPESADPAEGVSELRFVGDRAVAARLGARPFTFGWAAWDVRTGRSAARPTGPDNWGQGDLSPDGRRVVQTGPLRVVDRDAGREVWRDGAKDEGTSPHMVRFTPDGRRLVLRFGQSIEFRDADTGLTEKTIPAPNGGRLFGLSPDGRYALVDQLLPRDGDTPMPGEGLAAVDLTTGETATTFGDDTLGAGSAAAVSPDGRRVGYAVCRYETRSTGPRSWSHSLVAAKLVVREVGTWREVGRFDCPPAGTWASAPAFSPDGRRVALAEADGASIRDADTGRVVREFPLGGPATALTFSPDGTTLATAANGTAVYLWDLSGTRTGPAAEFREPHPTA
ncbi:MAG: hypothetical protein K2X87_09950, partial [Gemmataceae bacterium]|nr:hypothetical protein [Gemmataceae bacterium]